MEDFTITTRTSAKDYGKALLIRLYRDAGFILAAILGVYLLSTVILDYFGVISYYSHTPYFELSCALFLLLAPLLITFMAVRQFASNPHCQKDIKFTFGERGMSLEGDTFKGEFLWAHIVKQKEVSKFLVLYQSKRTGNFIDKTKLTSEQLEFIKSKVRKK